MNDMLTIHYFCEGCNMDTLSRKNEEICDVENDKYYSCKCLICNRESFVIVDHTLPLSCSILEVLDLNYICFN